MTNLAIPTVLHANGKSFIVDTFASEEHPVYLLHHIDGCWMMWRDKVILLDSDVGIALAMYFRRCCFISTIRMLEMILWILRKSVSCVSVDEGSKYRRIVLHKSSVYDILFA